MEDHYSVSDTDDLPEVASHIVETLEKTDKDKAKIVLFHGSMGAGKTTLIKALCEQMGVEDIVTSPTFALVNEYKKADGEPIYHFDFYRIDNLEEVFDLGYEEYFYSGALCLVEWPEKIEQLIPYDDPSVSISLIDITVNDKGGRYIDVKTEI